MTVELKWNIGKGDGASIRLDIPPFRAYFYWIDNGHIVESADFSKSELQVEIARRTRGGEEIAPFEAALKQLLLAVWKSRSFPEKHY